MSAAPADIRSRTLQPPNDQATAAKRTAPLAEPPVATPPSLAQWLGQQSKYALGLAPGFFGFYAHIGVLKALDEAGLLEGKVSFVSGASAGALVGGLYAAGLNPSEMAERVVAYQRGDFWDPPGVGAMLRGRAFEGLIRSSLPEGVTTFDQCRLPLGVTGYSLSRLTTRVMREGDIALALRASCTFPVLFQPVWHPQGVLMDGGVFDTAGMWSIPTDGDDYRCILNITFGTGPVVDQVVPPSLFPCRSHPRPPSSGNHRKEIVSFAITGVPRPHPFAMHKGADAIEAAYELVRRVLNEPMMAGEEEGHWLVPTVTDVTVNPLVAATTQTQMAR
eukprot:TRINITY_DN9021_c0_g1_i2.p1 TRINITY_DN9021_c0_g1~~TRINITY_DN9021_c0_g1_i2.p1  ORF type:complete len:386 (-),score=62.71 TRINITY_DN9021_c0_g1_i2:190-1188(-)